MALRAHVHFAQLVHAGPITRTLEEDWIGVIDCIKSILCQASTLSVWHTS